MKKWILITLATPFMAIGCGKSHSNSPAAPQATISSSQNLFNEYGGEPTISKIVDDIYDRVRNDPQTSSHMSLIDQNGYESEDEFKSCMELQLVALLGGPAQYPGTSHYRNAPPSGYACVSMKMAHSTLNLPSAEFNAFVQDMIAAMEADGISVSDAETKIRPALLAQAGDIEYNGAGTP